MVHREWKEAWLNEAPLEQWMRFQPPLPRSRIAEVFGLNGEELEDAPLNTGEEGLIRDVAVAGQGTDLICDAENLELLLRLTRAGARPEIQERPASILPFFLALRQGFFPVTPAAGLGEWAAGLCLPTNLWEAEILPARRKNYHPQSLDEELREGRLLWYGAGKGRAGFCRPEDLDLFNTAPETNSRAETPLPPADFFDRPRDYWEIKDAAGATNSGMADKVLIPAIWEQAWAGKLSADTWEPLRHVSGDHVSGDRVEVEKEGAYSPFTSNYRRVPKALRDRWKQGAPLPGRWYSLESETVAEDPWFQDELDRDHVRLLLRRWGILCRPLLERENSAWARLLPTMRRMELAGELVAGRFFSGINSLQFASPAILRELEAAEQPGPEAPLFWMNAADPASPAGLDIEGLDPRLPARSPRNRLYYRGAELIAVSKRNGKELAVFIPPEDPAAEKLVELIKAPRQRYVSPEKKLAIETINNTGAVASPYGPLFIRQGFISDRGKLFLW
jgi:ATP-dependent Lhr-like helicase